MAVLFDKMEEYGCEKIAFFYNKGVGLKAIIAIMTLHWDQPGGVPDYGTIGTRKKRSSTC